MSLRVSIALTAGGNADDEVSPWATISTPRPEFSAATTTAAAAAVPAQNATPAAASSIAPTVPAPTSSRSRRGTPKPVRSALPLTHIATDATSAAAANNAAQATPVTPDADLRDDFDHLSAALDYHPQATPRAPIAPRAVIAPSSDTSAAPLSNSTAATAESIAAPTPNPAASTRAARRIASTAERQAHTASHAVAAGTQLSSAASASPPPAAASAVHSSAVASPADSLASSTTAAVGSPSEIAGASDLAFAVDSLWSLYTKQIHPANGGSTTARSAAASRAADSASAVSAVESISRSEYTRLYVAIASILYSAGTVDESAAVASADVDWTRDTASSDGVMTLQAYTRSILEVAKQWTQNGDWTKQATFLGEIYRRLTGRSAKRADKGEGAAVATSAEETEAQSAVAPSTPLASASASALSQFNAAWRSKSGRAGHSTSASAAAVAASTAAHLTSPSPRGSDNGSAHHHYSDAEALTRSKHARRRSRLSDPASRVIPDRSGKLYPHTAPHADNTALKSLGASGASGALTLYTPASTFPSRLIACCVLLCVCCSVMSSPSPSSPAPKGACPGLTPEKSELKQFVVSGKVVVLAVDLADQLGSANKATECVTRHLKNIDGTITRYDGKLAITREGIKELQKVKTGLVGAETVQHWLTEVVRQSMRATQAGLTPIAAPEKKVGASKKKKDKKRSSAAALDQSEVDTVGASSPVLVPVAAAAVPMVAAAAAAASSSPASTPSKKAKINDAPAPESNSKAKMKFCPPCGTKRECDTHPFCGNCGHKF